MLDHHASAEKELSAIPDRYKAFVMKQSGCTLSWDYFHGKGSGSTESSETPIFFRYLEDKDIWRWALRDSEEFSAGFGTIGAGKPTFAALDELLEKGESGVEEIISRGKSILDYKNKVKDSHVQRSVPCRLIAAPQYACLIVNGSTIASEIGNAMCQLPNVQCGIIWSYDHVKKSLYVSIRSDRSVFSFIFPVSPSFYSAPQFSQLLYFNYFFIK